MLSTRPPSLLLVPSLPLCSCWRPARQLVCSAVQQQHWSGSLTMLSALSPLLLPAPSLNWCSCRGLALQLKFSAVQ
ncbi:hypothetical protein FOA52_008185 [Chlamydomonas sp. UWO 241]|nr:hypothetical protein FOA52_008185 [Chlamydomonas sp. UWO 241]